MKYRVRSIAFATALGLIILFAVVVGCQTSSSDNVKPPKRTLTVYGFSVQEEVMTKEIFPAFATYWKQKTDEEVVFRTVFTGSEEIAQAIIDGAPADVAILSNEQHAIWLQINSYIETDWRDLPYEGIVSYSPLVIIVRPGNPQNIRGWTDLARSGIRVVHANPRTSGGAQWALLAEYGSAVLNGATHTSAQQQVQDIWANVVSSPASSRTALKEFLFGVGDALITYEQDALLAQARSATIEIIIPRQTIMSEHIVAIVDRNVSEWDKELVSSFTSFLWTEAAQRAFARYYFRPVNPNVLDALISTQELSTEGDAFFSEVEQPFFVGDLGGWSWAYSEIVQGIWEEQIARHVTPLTE
jgi:sulfate transport system substrate-binding protein